MKFQVKRKSDGELIEISLAEYDADLHEEIPEQSERSEMDDLVAGLAKVVSDSQDKLLERLGAGQVDHSKVVARPGGVEREEAETPKRYESESAPYDAVLRARFSWERSPQIMGLPTQEARDQRVDDVLQIHDWRAAMIRKDVARADKIGYESQCRAWGEDLIRQISTAPGSAGAMIPVPLEADIVQQRELADKITPFSRQRQSDNTQLRYPGQNATLTVAGKTENQDGTTVTPTWVDNVLTKKAAMVITRTSREADEDVAAGLSIAEDLARQAGRAFGLYYNEQGLNGDGTGTNWTGGMIPNATDGVTGAAGPADDTVALTMLYAMPSEYWDNLAWYMDQTSLASFAKVTQGSSGIRLYPNLNVVQAGPVVGDSAASGMGGIEGIPVRIVPGGVSGANGIVVLANMDLFSTLVVPGIRAEASTETGDAMDKNQIQWTFYSRQDGQVDQAQAFVRSTNAITG